MQPSRALTRPAALTALAATALLALLLAATATARTTITDPKRETRALADHGRLDIIRATADKRSGTLIHTVTMRKRVRESRANERPQILINTRGGGRTDPEFTVFGTRVYRVKKGGDTVAIGRARVGARGRTWTYRFESSEIPDLGRYGWAALTRKGRTSDVAPGRRYSSARARALQAAIAR